MLDWVKIKDDGNYIIFDLRADDKILLSALDAAQHNIKYIVNNYPAPYTLYLSGGVDSQAMLYSWLLSGHNFSTFSAVFNKNYNSEDLESLDNFASKHNIKINFVNVDVIKFLENEHDHFAKTFRCGSPHITTYMKLLSMTTAGTSIMSGNFINQVKGPNLDYNQLGLYYYGKISKQSIVPFFFLETKELAYSFIMPRYIPPSWRGETIKTGPIGKRTPVSNISGYDGKVETYHLNGFPVEKQKVKFTGFEKIKEHYDHYPNKIHPKYLLERNKLQTSTRNFDILFRNKYEAMISATYKYTVLFSEGSLKYAQ